MALEIALNPQREFGADVVTRISAAVESESARREMFRLVNAGLETVALQLMSRAGVEPVSLKRVAIAGNPAMEHLLLNLPVASLASVPYRPLFTEGKTFRTKDIGWGLDAELDIFPLPGGFVGGDLIAFLYGQAVHKSHVTNPPSRLFVDLGTNAEIALGTGNRIYATSAAAGPAFEAASLSSGMPALPGAVNLVTIRGDRVELSTIGNIPPKGICGTGALTAVVSLLQAGLMESDGRLLSPEEIPSNLACRIIARNGELAFLVYKGAGCEIFLAQKDIREIQLAKGAIRGGVEVLLERAGTTVSDIAELTVSGSFGFSISADCLKRLGVIPPDLADKVRFVPDGALAGVERFLRRSGGTTEVSELAGRVTMVPLSGSPLFEKLFMQHMNFPSCKDSDQ